MIKFLFQLLLLILLRRKGYVYFASMDILYYRFINGVSIIYKQSFYYINT